MDVAVKVRDLKKIYITKERKGFFGGKKRRVEALKGISFEIRRGEIFGLLGPNGAGKTTTIKILSTLLLPDEGDAWVNGHHVVDEAPRVRESIGVSLYSDRGFYWKLTGRENLIYFAHLYHLDPRYAKERINYLLKLVDLEKDADRLVEEYSTGMKSKLNFARALLHDPPIVFLDEPTIGLDPNSARKVREVIMQLKDEGKTVLLTTHNMYEADILCDRIAIISKGTIAAIGTPSELKAMVEKHKILEIEVVGFDDSLVGNLRDVPGVINVAVRIRDPVSMRGEIKVVTDGNGILPEILGKLVERKVKVVSIRSVEPTLEDVFVYLTGERLEAEEDGVRATSRA
ncbi:MAG: ABC transporter ATP-binding protein [Thermoprotei archaeon]|nr:MAG: ABC transporter ATP-binding protein [Thermoprotei archaeon]